MFLLFSSILISPPSDSHPFFCFLYLLFLCCLFLFFLLTLISTYCFRLHSNPPLSPVLFFSSVFFVLLLAVSFVLRFQGFNYRSNIIREGRRVECFER